MCILDESTAKKKKNERKNQQRENLDRFLCLFSTVRREPRLSLCSTQSFYFPFQKQLFSLSLTCSFSEDDVLSSSLLHIFLRVTNHTVDMHTIFLCTSIIIPLLFLKPAVALHQSFLGMMVFVNNGQSNIVANDGPYIFLWVIIFIMCP